MAARKSAPLLLSTLTRLNHGRIEDAEDLLQQTFAAAWRARGSYYGGPVEAWLYCIARNVHLTWLRSHYRRDRLREALARHALVFERFGPDSEIDVEQLLVCLDQLVDHDRRIVDLFYGREGNGPAARDQVPPSPSPHSDAEVAQILSASGPELWSSDRVRKRRQRALLQVERCLDQHARQEGGP